MDITLIKTFLEVAATGSFVSASDHLFVTQSAVSLRIQRLEDSLGQPLFTRSKAGAELTSAGKEFENYALSLIKIWEEARQQIAIPEGFTRSLTIGAQYSLWPRLGFRWVDDMQKRMPELTIRGEVGMPDRLTRFIIEGVIQAALVYTPQTRPGLTVEPVLDDDLVLVASWKNPTLPLDGQYVFVDWGPEFIHAHNAALPNLHHNGLTFALGAMALDYIIHRRAAAYLPARSVKRHLDAGRLHLVPHAPTFPYPIWSVWRDDADADVVAIAKSSLRDMADGIDHAQDDILQNLADLSR
ncbi:LysR family transcriptional regulator [Amylibacter kogurei]|uniref:LysR family transcriptional regulator n=1 Tax=Paramylibacter kogurei TaxID=1889778 RepID=A0A2G5K782_9RHOB|nr:LysR family transcriptional regulator [Amylibacter kogurei]PIB24710.1 LysR family transcriptional regulator [Amylibacter kogurei]